MRNLLLLVALAALLVFAVTGCDPDDDDDTSVVDDDSADDDVQDDDTADDDDDSAAGDVSWSLETVHSATLDSVTGVQQALTMAHNEFTYVLPTEAEYLVYLTDALVQPMGSYCLGTNEPVDNCVIGTLWTSGMILDETDAVAMCADHEDGRLFVIKTGERNSNIEVLDESAGGDTAYSYHFATDLLRIDEDLTAEGLYDGPCAYLPDADALVLTSPSLGVVIAYSFVTETWLHADLGFAMQGIAPLDGGASFVVDDADTDTFVVLSGVDLSELQTVPSGGEIVHFDVDPATGIGHVAHGSDGLVSRIAFGDPDPQPLTLPVPGDPQLVATDPDSQLGVVASRISPEEWVLQLVSGDGLADEVEIAARVEALSTPSPSGQVVVLTHPEDEGIQFTAYDAVADQPLGPPLYGFLFTAIEEPNDHDFEMPCTGGGSFDELISKVENNAEVLGGLGIPVAVGITYNFVATTERCGQTQIFELLDDHGFQLGSMVHNRPCYNCSDADLDWTSPDTCMPGSPNYCNPAQSDSCCFPGDDNYCGLGDWECYQPFIDERNLVVDGNMPGGGDFITGAERHGAYGWDWIRGYREMARADGSFGYDTTVAIQGWAYVDEVSYVDPRGKEPAPWCPRDRLEPWALADYLHWTADSAFSDLIYLPGLPISTNKLLDWHSSGLYMADFLDNSTAITYSEHDFDVLSRNLRKTLALRGPVGPNVWYFHIHDMALLNLVDPDGVEMDGAQYLRDWIDEVNDTWVADGELIWAFPSDIRALVGP